MELNKIKEAADRYGTPLYLFDLDCIRDRVQRFRDAFGDRIGLGSWNTAATKRAIQRSRRCSFKCSQIGQMNTA